MIAQEVTPILNVSDLPVSLAWFQHLGWHALWSWGDPPDFAAVGSGECAIFLSLVGRSDGERNDRRSVGRAQRPVRVESGACLWVRVNDVDEVYRRCLENGHDVIQPPTDEPWGSREMELRHPDGHILRIGYTPDRDHHHSDDGHDHPHPH
jgi:hypothetical protein